MNDRDLIPGSHCDVPKSIVIKRSKLNCCCLCLQLKVESRGVCPIRWILKQQKRRSARRTYPYSHVRPAIGSIELASSKSCYGSRQGYLLGLAQTSAAVPGEEIQTATARGHQNVFHAVLVEVPHLQEVNGLRRCVCLRLRKQRVRIVAVVHTLKDRVVTWSEGLRVSALHRHDSCSIVFIARDQIRSSILIKIC